MDIYLGFFIKMLVGFILVIFMFRIMGRKEFAQMTPIDMLWIMMISELFGGVAHTTDLSVFHLVYVLLLWGLFIWILEKITHKSNKAEWIINGRPVTIIQDGEILEDVMERENLNYNQVHTQLREQGIFDIDQVREGVLEVSGRISIYKKS